MTKEIMNTQKYKVRNILTSDTEARGNDILLWADYLLAEEIIDTKEYYTLIGIGQKAKGNTYESISRARRKVQEEEPELASERMKKIRAEKELEYRETYRR